MHTPSSRLCAAGPTQRANPLARAHDTLATKPLHSHASKANFGELRYSEVQHSPAPIGPGPSKGCSLPREDLGHRDGVISSPRDSSSREQPFRTLGDWRILRYGNSPRRVRRGYGNERGNLAHTLAVRERSPL